MVHAWIADFSRSSPCLRSSPARATATPTPPAIRPPQQLVPTTSRRRPAHGIPASRCPPIASPRRGAFSIARAPVHATLRLAFARDACDSKPRDANGNVDRTCLDQFRKAICTTKLDFVFLTDHRGAFADTDFPDVLLHDPARGDRLAPESRANWAACEMQDPVLLMAGTESGTTPVGLEHHVAGTHDERMARHDSKSLETIDELKKAGAVSLVVHTED